MIGCVRQSQRTIMWWQKQIHCSISEVMRVLWGIEFFARHRVLCEASSSLWGIDFWLLLYYSIGFLGLGKLSNPEGVRRKECEEVKCGNVYMCIAYQGWQLSERKSSDSLICGSDSSLNVRYIHFKQNCLKNTYKTKQ